MKSIILSLLILGLCSLTSGKEEQRVFCDFESADYAGWTVTGNAFGTGPACGTLPNQKEVTGYCGKRLINSFLNGNESTGTLTSPPFLIELPYISFLIGGGGYDGTHIDLLIDGKQVRTARGPNLTLDGHERMDWFSWDVTELQGMMATIQIVDNKTNLWGHLCIDQIVFGMNKLGPEDAIREITLEKRYLHLPVKTGNPSSWMRIEVDDTTQYEFPIALAESDSNASFHATLDMFRWQGKKVRLVWEREKTRSNQLDFITQSNELLNRDTSYREKYRPQFHFSARCGWLNDPNGLVYFEGEYHLFFQHDPFSVYPTIKAWGHAVSSDLFHWTQLPDAMMPDRYGLIFSGSAVVDHNNSSGFGNGTKSPLVAFYTSYGQGMRYGELTSQCLAFSRDRGRTWTKYEHNPVIPNINSENRDPKVFWHEASKAWIMALYMDNSDYALFRSSDLKSWKQSGLIENPGCVECPDFFELPVDGNEQNKKWVFGGANGRYVIGSFDGWNFHPETESLTSVWGHDDYGAQSFDNTPGRRIQISWMAGVYYPLMPYSQQMTIPRELTLRSTENCIRLCINPVRELDSLRVTGIKKDKIAVNKTAVIPLPNSELLDLILLVRTGNAKRIVLSVHEKTITLLPQEGVFYVDHEKVPLAMDSGLVDLRIILDRTSIEVFAHHGLAQLAQYLHPSDSPDFSVLKVKSDGSGTLVEQMEAYPLKSIWK